MYNGSTRHKSRKLRAFRLQKSWMGQHSTVTSTQTNTYTNAHTHTHTHTHVHTCARARDPRTDTRSGLHTLCLHSPITDSRSYAIMIDLPAWLMTGELPSAKSDGHDFRAGRSTIRELVEARLYECAEEKRERESEDRRWDWENYKIGVYI